MSNFITISLAILNRQYNVKVEAENEVVVKQRMKDILEKLNYFKTHFPGKDNQDYLSMALIDSVSNSTETENEKLKYEHLLQQLQELNSILD